MFDKKTNEEIRIGILGTVSNLIPQAVLAFTSWILWDFFSKDSFLFWFSASFFVLSAYLLYKRQYAAAVLALSVLIVSIISVSLAVNTVIISDQERMQYRNTYAGSFLELPASNISSRLLPYLWPQKRIVEVLDCDQVKIAKLPLLPYPPVTATSPELPKTPFLFRRLPPARVTEVEILTIMEKGVEKKDDVDRNVLGIQAGFTRRDYSPHDVSVIFPRNISCTFSGVVGIPVLEYLPWNPDNVESFFIALTASRRLAAAYTNGVFNVDVLRAIYDSGLVGEYRTLFNFISYRLATIMLQGNIAAELRADLRNNACLALAAAPKLFDGPFSSLRDDFFREVAAVGRRDYRQLFEACSVPEEFLSAAEKDTSDARPLPQHAQIYARCVAESGDREKFGKCLRETAIQNAEAPTDHEPNPNPRLYSSEELLWFLEGPYSRFVVDKHNVLRPITNFSPMECPSLKNRREEQIVISRLMSQSAQIFLDQLFCSARDGPVVQSKIAEFRTIMRCAKDRGFTEKDDEWVSGYITWARSYRCGEHMSYEEMQKLPQLAELSFSSSDITHVANNIRQFSFLLKERTIKEIATALDQFAELFQAVCSTKNVSVCLADLGAAKEPIPEWLAGPSKASLIKIAEEKGLLRKDLITEQSTLREWIDASSNRIVHIIMCNALADQKLSALVGVTREDFCRSRGLTRYMRVADNLTQEKIAQWFVDKEDPRRILEALVVRTRRK